MTKIAIMGEPVAVFTFWDLPSWNVVLVQHWTERDTKQWRADGCRLAQSFKFKAQRGTQKRGFLVDRCLLIAKVYTPTEARMDVFNKNIKAVTDGFTDAKIWADDEWVTVPMVLFTWGGIDAAPIMKQHRTKKTPSVRTEIEVHELEAFYINRVRQVLPLRREKK